MQRIRQLALLLATLAGVVVFAVAPVAAEDGSGSGGSGSGSGGSGDSTTSTTTTTESKTETTETETPEVKTEVTSLREQAKELLQHERDSHKQKSTEERQKSCEARATEINNRVKNYATAAQRHLGVFDSIFAKVQAFYTTKKLNVSNYDTLVATVKDKQAAAQTAVDTLKALDTNIDCKQSDPAQTVQAVKTAVKNAREALQAYRTAIKDLIVAIKGASTADKSTTGGDQ